MTERERICTFYTRHGYEVENLGLMTFINYEDYYVIRFWNEDGSPDTTKSTYWGIHR